MARLVACAAMLVAGCSLIVPDSMPPYVCGSGVGACPDGMTCDLATHACVFPSDATASVDAGKDAVSPDVADVAVEVAADAPTTCRTLGCSCSGASDCDSRICAQDTQVTPALYNAVGHNFCTAPCCTSSDCAGGFVCFASAAGGNYCVAPSVLQRSTPGTALGGAPCNADSQCRSGLCATTCQDTCCSMTQPGECGAGACRFGTFPGKGFDTHFTALCTTAGGTVNTNGYCGSSNSACKSDFCFYNYCAGGCRNSKDCSGYCSYDVDSQSNIFAACSSTGAGTTAFGGTCAADTDCATTFCDPTSKRCTDACFGDVDCTSVSGWFCRPEALKLKSGGYASVLLCGG